MNPSTRLWKTKPSDPDLVPMWDSSDPSRNPPPMPLHPESPNLNTVEYGSPARMNTSPLRSGRNTSTLNTNNNMMSVIGDKLTQLLEQTGQLIENTENVESSVKESMMEFGSLAHRSRDNASALGDLKQIIKKTEQISQSTFDNMAGYLPQIVSAQASNESSLRQSQENMKVIFESLQLDLQALARNMQLIQATDSGKTLSEANKALSESIDIKIEDLETSQKVQMEAIKTDLLKETSLLQKSITESYQKMLQSQQSELENASNNSKSINQQLHSIHASQTASLLDIQADVRSIIDSQHSEVFNCSQQIKMITERLEGMLSLENAIEQRAAEAESRAETLQLRANDAEIRASKAEQRALEAEQRALNAEQRASEAEKKGLYEQQETNQLKAQLTLLTSEHKSLNKYNEEVNNLQSQIKQLDSRKSSLIDEVAMVKGELAVSLKEYELLESRVAEFEDRVNRTVLERSKGILANSTLSLMRSSERKPLSSTTGQSPTKRHMSLVAEDFDILGKENNDIMIVGKSREKGRDNPIREKNRSVSLFVD